MIKYENDKVPNKYESGRFDTNAGKAIKRQKII